MSTTKRKAGKTPRKKFFMHDCYTAGLAGKRFVGEVARRGFTDDN